METIFMNMENSKTNDSHKFIFNLSQRLDLRSSDKHVTLKNLSIYYTWKNIVKQYKKNKLEIIIKWFYSVSDIQDYIKYIQRYYIVFPWMCYG